MAVQFIPFVPLGGVNSELLPDSIGDGEVVDSSNFVFARGRARTRGGVIDNTLSGVGQVTWSKTVMAPTVPGVYYLTQVAGTGAIHLYRMTTSGVYIGELTGTALLGNTFGSICAVNNVVLFAGNSTGAGAVLVRYDGVAGGGLAYTTIAYGGAYLAAHGARALVAYDGTYRNRVSWSVVGDETDWAGVGSGHTDLADSGSYINGLGVLNDTIVVCRYDGFHFGYPTGSGSMPYRFENKSRDGIGPSALYCTSFYDDMMFFVGDSDVYMFSSQGLKGIGGTLRHEIIDYVIRNVPFGSYYKSTVTPAFNGERGIFYHLTPGFPALTATYKRDPGWIRRRPHFVYSLKEDKWMKFYYPGVSSEVFPTIVPSPTSLAYNEPTVGVFGEGDLQYYVLDPSIGIETEAFFRSKSMLVGSPDKDMTLHRAMLRYRNQGTSEVDVKASADLNGNRVEVTDRVAIGVDPADGKMKRQWVNMELTGNDFEFEVRVPPGNKLETNMIGGSFEPAPEYQGA